MLKRGNAGRIMQAAEPAYSSPRRSAGPQDSDAHYASPGPIRGTLGNAPGASTQLFGSPFGRAGGGSHASVGSPAMAATPPPRFREPVFDGVNIVMSPSFRGKVQMGEQEGGGGDGRGRPPLPRSSLRGGRAGPALPSTPMGTLADLLATSPPTSAVKVGPVVDLSSRLSPDAAARGKGKKRRPSRYVKCDLV